MALDIQQRAPKHGDRRRHTCHEAEGNETGGIVLRAQPLKNGGITAAAIELRGDFTGENLRLLARCSRDAKQVRRLLALAVIGDGGSRTEASRIGGVGLQIAPDWVVRFNAEGAAGLVDRKAPGKAPTLTPEQRAALAGAVEAGPQPWRDGVVRWRLIDLVQWLWTRSGYR